MISRRAMLALPVALPVALAMRPEPSLSAVVEQVKQEKRDVRLFQWDMYQKLMEKETRHYALEMATAWFAGCTLYVETGMATISFPQKHAMRWSKQNYGKEIRAVCIDLYGADAVQFHHRDGIGA